MNKAFRLKMAKRRGEQVVKENEFTSLPINPSIVAERKKMTIQAKPDSDGGVSGMLLRHGDNFGILYTTHIKNEGFQRFSIAHELGHYFLDGHIDHILPSDGIHVSEGGFVSGDSYELEADHFAAGFLMPELLFQRAIGKFEPGLEAVEGLKELCVTSLTATAIRYAELCEEAVAVVISTGPSINYCCMSETMKSLPQISWLKHGYPVPANTVTSQLNSSPDRIAQADNDEEEINIMDWLGGVRSVSAIEQVVGLGNYGKTLTVLTCPSLVDDTYRDETDEEDEVGMIDSWTPRFRR